MFGPSSGKTTQAVASSLGVFTSSGRYCRGPMVVSAASPEPSAVCVPGTNDENKTYAGRRVVLTREAGKNGEMMRRLTARGVDCVEMPLVETTEGPDAAALPTALRDPTGWTWVCITSPESASVFLRAWREAGEPDVPIATVGKGTSKVLKEAYASGALTAPTFTPSVANAVTLVEELPLPTDGGVTPRVLYPASAKAATTLQEGLEARGAVVERLDTYSTEKVTAVAEDVLARAKEADVVTFGSPSAVKAWVAVTGLDGSEEGVEQKHPLYACIGSTSAAACEKVGLPGVHFPQSPGMDGWEGTVCEALDSL